MMAAGADIIDIGAESTRPGAKRVAEADELARITGAVKTLIPAGAILSIDTTRASVAAAALSEGAQIINDVSGGTLDAELPHVVADHDCLYIVQHWRGWLAGSKGANPDQDTSVYEHGVLTDVHDELMRQVDGVLAAGVKPERIIIDPGLGFSKPGIEHNLPLLTGLETFRATGYPVLIGQTRDKIKEAAERLGVCPCILCENLEEAVKICAEKANPGDAVLLSPACASWGQFDNYEQRGDMFKEYVRAL